jgi:hypothetical protein
MVNNATGLWDVSDYGSTPKFAAGIKNEVYISEKDKNTLKKLALEVRSIAARDIEKEKKQKWILHNDLKLKEPLIFCDPENGWNEIITGNLLKCEGSLAKKWEVILKKEIFWGTKILDDKVIQPYFSMGYTYSDSGWGLKTGFHGGGGGSYIWDAPLKSEADADKMRFPKIEIDYKTTNETLELANEIFTGILEVRLKGIWWWSLGLTTSLAFLRGLQNLMVDMIDNPGLIHRIMKFLMEGTLAELKYLEESRLLFLNDDSYVGSGGFGFTEQLPQKGFSVCAVRTADMWGFSESQETTGISPAMFEEFIFQYQLPILKLFGLNCYGCCEPIEKRWSIVKRIPNLRRVSVSSWANFEKMTQNLQDDYIYSLKMTPTDLSVPVMDEEVVRKRIRNILDIAKGCIIEIIMKDNHTIGNNPGNVIRWTKIAREESEKVS